MVENDTLIIEALQRSIRAEEAARYGHHRLDRINGQIGKNAEELGALKERVSVDIASVQRRITEEATQTREAIAQIRLDVKPLTVKMALIGIALTLILSFLGAILVKVMFG